MQKFEYFNSEYLNLKDGTHWKNTVFLKEQFPPFTAPKPVLLVFIG